MSAAHWVSDGARLPAGAVAPPLLRDGQVGDGFDLPVEPWDLGDGGRVCAGVVEDEASLSAAVLAAARGASVVVACPDAALRARLVDDLRRTGPTELVELGPDPAERLDEEQRAVLAQLAAGSTLASAAQQLHLSTRTAERRIAAARATLGVSSTAELVALAQRSHLVQELMP